MGEHSTSGRDEPPDGNAKREQPRDSLMLVAALYRGVTGVAGTEAAEPLRLRVRNLSAGGLMADMTDQAEAFEVAESVEVELRGVGRVSGHVAWQAEDRIGIAFDRPIDPQQARKPVGGGRPADMAVRVSSTPLRRPGLRTD